MKTNWIRVPLLIAAAGMLGMASPVWAQEAAEAGAAYDAAAEAGVSAYAIDNMFLMFCAVLVLFMQAGFALVESGFNSAKNTVNILFKNLMDGSCHCNIFDAACAKEDYRLINVSKGPAKAIIG